MSGKSKQFELDVLRYVFNSVDVPSITDTLYVSLHTADPTDTGVQMSYEATYAGYARIALPRTSVAWTVADINGASVASPAASIVFPVCTSGTNTITHFGIGTTATGAGKLLYLGVCTPNITVTAGIVPILNQTTKIVET